MPEREWEYQGHSLIRRMGEVMARFLIGGTWGVLMFILISHLIHLRELPYGTWAAVAYISLVFWGIEMALPPIKREENE